MGKRRHNERHQAASEAGAALTAKLQASGCQVKGGEVVRPDGKLMPYHAARRIAASLPKNASPDMLLRAVSIWEPTEPRKWSPPVF